MYLRSVITFSRPPKCTLEFSKRTETSKFTQVKIRMIQTRSQIQCGLLMRLVRYPMVGCALQSWNTDHLTMLGEP